MERRSHDRKTRFLSVEISWHEAGAHIKQAAKVINASPGGLGLIVKLAIPVGSPVTISSGKKTFIGMVEHQSIVLAGWLIGVEIDSCATPFPAKSTRESIASLIPA